MNIAIPLHQTTNQKLEPIIGDTKIHYIDQAIVNLLIQNKLTPLFITSKKHLQLVKSDIQGIILPGSFLDSQLKHFTNPQDKPENFTSDKHKDQLDQELVQLSLQKKIPLLGICRGLQTINIALGGSLKFLKPNSIHTTRKKPGRHTLNHKVEIIPNTIIHKAFQKQNSHVNGIHKVQIDKLGKNLIASMLCPKDKGIEAIELPNHPFFLGVQFHPELRYSIDQKFTNIFHQFFQASVQHI